MKRLAIPALILLCAASSCARLIGADFDRKAATDGEADALNDGGDGPSLPPPGDGGDTPDIATDGGDAPTAMDDGGDGPSPPVNDGGDGPVEPDSGMDDGGDAADRPDDAGDPDADRPDGDAPDSERPDGGPDGNTPDSEGRDSGSAGDASGRDSGPDPCTTCSSNQICCDGMCKPLDANNCFACGAVCDSSRPVCAVDRQICVCTDASCPEGQSCVGGVCSRSTVPPLATPAMWTKAAYYGGIGTPFADVDGDGRADAIKVNLQGITVYRASANGTFIPNSWALTEPFYGAHGTFFADVTGDGCADAIAIGDTNIIVRRSNCSNAFGASEIWGPRETLSWQHFIVDVQGDGCADMVDVMGFGVVVRPAMPCPAPGATKARFSKTEEAWTTNPFYGDTVTTFTDVTGDGRADAIAVNLEAFWPFGVIVRRSDGTQFLDNEQWTYETFNGWTAILFADVTGDGMADVLATKADGAYMWRSNRWFFGGAELLSDALLSPSGKIAGPSIAATDVTGDGRADLVQVNDEGISVHVKVDRRIPIRFIQLVADAASGVTRRQLEETVSLANLVHRPAGVQFYIRAAEVVASSALHDLTKTTSAHRSELGPATDHFNPGCNAGADLDDLPLAEQMKIVATRCALDGEILIYVARIGSSTALLPWEGKAFFMDPIDLLPKQTGGFRLAHELGHYLGLPHTFGCCGDTALSQPDLVPGNLKDPRTGGPAPLSLFWDLVYAPMGSSNLMFDDALRASEFENELKPIQATDTATALTTGWYCPSTDATRVCDATTPAGGICLQISDPQGETRNYCSGDRDLKGLGLQLRDGSPAINVMSSGYSSSTSDPLVMSQRQPTLSLSQIEQIQRTLSNDVNTPIRDAAGQIISGGRPRLGR